MWELDESHQLASLLFPPNESGTEVSSRAPSTFITCNSLMHIFSMEVTPTEGYLDVFLEDIILDYHLHTY